MFEDDARALYYTGFQIALYRMQPVLRESLSSHWLRQEVQLDRVPLACSMRGDVFLDAHLLARLVPLSN